LNVGEIREAIEELARRERPSKGQFLPVLEALLSALERGEARAAEPEAGGWKVNRWVKEGILLCFRIGRDSAGALAPYFFFRDRDTLPTWDPDGCSRRVRLVPGGTTVRRGAFLADGVVVMPPAYINVGAYIGERSMVDSHALVGSCAQIGNDVHLSAAVQIGGVLEPVGALPVIVEDGVFVGGGCGVYEGTRVCRRAVLAPGVILTRATPVFDAVERLVHRASPEEPLVIPERAVVVPGTRPAKGEFARRYDLHLQAPVIVKYRDDSTDAALVLEEALR
jgi:2,3,4,5-tetrahydropyridine-2-carboxylate N-succinyltransferase